MLPGVKELAYANAAKYSADTPNTPILVYCDGEEYTILQKESAREFLIAEGDKKPTLEAIFYNGKQMNI